ncbi:hypothetical protein GCM10022226_43700 [Sphaerisporangium flaviroseum]|uniref:Uncharacterized protein n=1 Tax=Sphaerisporangium flaviroseum TaxID=509199 RepID=A0ABP7IH96_9ACTN
MIGYHRVEDAPTARPAATGYECKVANRTMRVMFLLTVIIVVAGLVYFLTVGLLGR